MLTDQLDQPITASDPRSIDAFDRALHSQLRVADDMADAWEASVAHEPGFAMGQIGRAYLRCLSSERNDAADARSILSGLGDGRDLTDRERRHLDAARRYSTGDLHGARNVLSALSVEHPHDLLALLVGHQLDFFCGDAKTLRDRPARVTLSWDPAQPHYGYVQGMLAFGLEECGAYDAATAAGHAALDADPRDVWALHAVVHAHEMRGEFEAGRRFMDERRNDWGAGNFFVVHNSWHEALFVLAAGDLDGVLQIYDTALRHEGSGNVALELLDATAMLWRLHLNGVDVGERWSVLADAWASILTEPWYAFNDVHAVMAFVGAGRLGDARRVVDGLASYVNGDGPSDEANRAMTAEVGLPVAAALVAFGEARYDHVVILLEQLRTIAHRFGGSHAQRDVLARTHLEAAIRAGNRSMATALVSERLATNPSSPYALRQLARLD